MAKRQAEKWRKRERNGKSVAFPLPISDACEMELKTNRKLKKQLKNWRWTCSTIGYPV